MKHLLKYLKLALLALVIITGKMPTPAQTTAPLHEGVVASTQTWNTITTGIQDSIHRKAHRVCDDVVAVKVLIANVYQLELACPGTRDFRMGIENYDGTFSQVTWSGSATKTLSGGQMAWSDWIGIKWRNHQLGYTRTWTHSSNSATAGVLFGGTYNRTNLGEWSDYGASGAIPDITLGGSPATQHNLTLGPMAIVAKTRTRGVFAWGDSRLRGSNSTGFAPIYNEDGEVAPTMSAWGVPFVNAGMGGEACYLWNNGTSTSTLRKEIAKYCTDLVIDVGINDFNGGGVNDTQFRASLTTVYNSLKFATQSGHPYDYAICSISPYTTSTDNWATTLNQTVFDSTKNSYRSSFNASVRAQYVEKATAFFDNASVTESGKTSSKWVANGTANYFARTDGLHGTTTANTAIYTAHVVRPEIFQRNRTYASKPSNLHPVRRNGDYARQRSNLLAVARRSKPTSGRRADHTNRAQSARLVSYVPVHGRP